MPLNVCAFDRVRISTWAATRRCLLLLCYWNQQSPPAVRWSSVSLCRWSSWPAVPSAQASADRGVHLEQTSKATQLACQSGAASSNYKSIGIGSRTSTSSGVFELEPTLLCHFTPLCSLLPPPRHRAWVPPLLIGGQLVDYHSPSRLITSLRRGSTPIRSCRPPTILTPNSVDASTGAQLQLLSSGGFLVNVQSSQLLVRYRALPRDNVFPPVPRSGSPLPPRHLIPPIRGHPDARPRSAVLRGLLAPPTLPPSITSSTRPPTHLDGNAKLTRRDFLCLSTFWSITKPHLPRSFRLVVQAI
ncbi:hypothetical protein C8J57DRAFT_1503118 [Mycena rebaudengoi]|nr:hypothetical protein C8J57DRAFT_1503118 [Mycena rebaudengoi]